ncbi:hypothetical protein PA598K_02257 [Paenibacillus sp. 598K]|uniref:precorrin-2 dehydrogenase/sirohydrochlorin ferrochelatase family protein n=1 Tax=Paenibacillus sp. 598K TaxID=1117987 RepID=UPI000FF9F3B4|nr:bifunctional precorrin-2 dehydrogenase/sirohydrochlorin ferrochelatase [Paenibacillus sp. 598K]GBF73932.1 hypothetical protein PA598K_02257 [Paenibacillus sp. 598K]
MTRYYPLMLKLEGAACVVVGGGAVAQRKVSGLLESGSAVTVISPAVTERLELMATRGELVLHRRAYRAGDLQGARLVFAATDDPGINRQVASEADRLSIPVNVADDPESGSFVTPATVRRGDLVLSVTASGASPMLASRIRQELEARYGPEYERLTAWLRELRRRVQQQGQPADVRRRMLERALELPEAWWQPEQSEESWAQLLDQLRLT